MFLLNNSLLKNNSETISTNTNPAMPYTEFYKMINL